MVDFLFFLKNPSESIRWILSPAFFRALRYKNNQQITNQKKSNKTNEIRLISLEKQFTRLPIKYFF